MCSMISGQCDKLREITKKLRVLANGPVNEGFPARAKLFEAADAMYQAADLILELRDDLQRANEAVRDAEHDESMAWDRVRKAEAESEKLRWLVRHLYEYRQLYFKTGIYPTDHGVTEQYMRELGVEVE